MQSSLFLGLTLAASVLAGAGVATKSALVQPAQANTGAQSGPPATLVFGDVDGDGLDDVLAIHPGGATRLLMNFGEGRFEDITLASNLAELGGASCALFADFDGDGHLDLFAGSSATRVWRNLGNGTFEATSSGIEHDLVDLSAQALDHDQDGRVDLQIHTESGDLVYRNMGEGRFERLELSLAPVPANVGWTAPNSVASPEVTGTGGTPTAAQRRLSRWSAGRILGGAPASSSLTAGPVGPGGSGSLPITGACVAAVSDSSGGGCIGASSVPALGQLYPLSNDFSIDPVTGNVGFGTSPHPGRRMTANGVIYAELGGLPSGSEVGLSTPNGEPGIIITRGDGSGGIASRWDISVRGTAFGIRDTANGFADRLTISTGGLVSVKQSLEIRGGADIVERFESSCGPLEPGTVVAIDPENPGQLACSFEAYDTKVAGVVSGAGGVKPGLCLSQDGVLDGETPVAMTGRVYVKCSTENGAIRPGDRLTTATLAGHAMKSTDSTRADGAVIGKAMSSLDEDAGLVLVLVNLQ